MLCPLPWRMGQETELLSCGIPLSARAEVATKPACPADYWSSFLAFTHLHMDELNHLLKQQMEKALIRSAECEYTMEYAAVLGAMWGVAEFMLLFLRELALDDSEILDDGWLDYVVALLEESEAQCEAPDGLAEGFLEFVRKAIRQKGLPCYRIGQLLSTIPCGAIYFAHGADSIENYKKLLRGLRVGEFLYVDSQGRPVINCVPRLEEGERYAKLFAKTESLLI